MTDSAPVRTRLWRNGVLEKEDFPFEDISEYLHHDDCVIWVGLTRPDHARLDALAGELSLDPLAVEDAVAHRERPKASHYATHTFLTAYALELESSTCELRAAQVSAFVLPHALVTVHSSDGFDMDTVVKRWDEDSELIDCGPKALAYHLLDVLVDSYFDVVQTLDDEMEALEDLLFADEDRITGGGASSGRASGVRRRSETPDDAGADQHSGRPASSVQRRSFTVRKALVDARRVILPMREVVNTLVRRDSDVPDRLRPYFDDLYDHVLRAAEWTESLRDMVTTVFETNLSLADARLNTIMKKLTSWAAIIAIPTAVTGFYGQNVPYPGFGQHWGFWTSSGIMVGLVVALYVGFKRRDWL